jgi:hypothetical protein
LQFTWVILSLVAEALRCAMNESRSLEDRLLSWTYQFLNQTAHRIVSGTATLEERLALWLLMVNDR